MIRRFILTVGLICAGFSVHAAAEIQEVESPGGFKAWLVEEPSIPFVALEIRFLGGASLDAPGKRGATNLMVGLLEEGAEDLDARGFAEARDGLAAQFRYDVGDDTVRISAKFLTETRDEAVDLLRASLVSPRFDEADIDRVRAQVISAIRSDATDPDEIVGDAFYGLVFGDHPYGTNQNGTLDSVTALTRDDIVAAHRAALAQDRVYVAAAGDISAEELGVLLDKLFLGLPETGAPQPADIEVSTTSGVTVVPFDTPQSVAIFGHKGMKRDDPDFFAAYVLNTIFGGGGFEARLMNEVREKRGLTYGVYSYLAPREHAELMLGRVASANDRMAETIQVIRDEWAKMASEGATPEELERAKTYLTGAYPLRFDGNAPIAKILVGMQLDGLSPDYVFTRNDKIEAVTLEDVKRVAGELMKPEELRFVVVGQPEGIESTVGQ
ncbi:M16 family metallopeptidase [Mameliella sediminis]|uniref:M16 family metallopeptidase n=1 Tax=Mameliella sediminis TaxID=2836866 RepID=UPI001C48C1BE|nr:pitrilysin family protein [Mameliella sediminis]MBV7396141.1 insulinase family protein [Mameliella sediminis]MBY6115081.1 insulinase family protein [Antarctobacter heliothermus]MBY6145034.1 insulinase family protein [Mameliella alba]MCA0955889.1 insulinase family protein [Mameliella alba]